MNDLGYDALTDAVYNTYDDTGASISYDGIKSDSSGAASTVVYGTPSVDESGDKALRPKPPEEPKKVPWVTLGLVAIGIIVVVRWYRRRR
jgi:hypothetical protein